MRTRMITVVQVCRDMGAEPTKDLTWSVGAIVRDHWEFETGTLPRKVLSDKTNAGGSHCMAAYPPRYRPIIEKAITAHGYERARQLDLFLA